MSSKPEPEELADELAPINRTDTSPPREEPASGAGYNQQRRATKYLGALTQPHHGFSFKPFTRESLLKIRERRNLRFQRRKYSMAAEKRDSSRKKGNQNQNAAAACAMSRQQQLELNRKDQLSQPDPYLASGQQLPPAFVRQLPAELVGKPMEDIDSYYDCEETFVIISRGKELTRFSAGKALYLLGPFHPIRKLVMCILVNPIFNIFVILTILTNCILMTVQASEAVEKTEIIFTIIYTTEMGLKVLARGFILDRFTYLRDPWNWLDFSVIVMAYLTIVVEDLGNLSVIRTFRVLRALKTVAIIPGMKTIVGAVIDSVKNLKDVMVLTLFSLSVFSLLGLQIYMGLLTQKCIENGPSNMSQLQWYSWSANSSRWLPDPDNERFGSYKLCGNATGAQPCPSGHTCLQGFGPNPDYGFTNFDTFGWALISSFRLMTQDFWEGLYMQVLKTAGNWHILFFLVSIFLGSIYLMNLILAIVAMSYNELQRRAEAEEEALAEDEAAFLNECRALEQLEAEQLSASPGSARRTSYRPSVEIGQLGRSLATAGGFWFAESQERSQSFSHQQWPAPPGSRPHKRPSCQSSAARKPGQLAPLVRSLGDLRRRAGSSGSSFRLLGALGRRNQRCGPGRGSSGGSRAPSSVASSRGELARQRTALIRIVSDGGQASTAGAQTSIGHRAQQNPGTVLTAARQPNQPHRLSARRAQAGAQPMAGSLSPPVARGGLRAGDAAHSRLSLHSLPPTRCQLEPPGATRPRLQVPPAGSCKGRARSQDLGGTLLESEAARAPPTLDRHRSEAAICRQPLGSSCALLGLGAGLGKRALAEAALPVHPTAASRLQVLGARAADERAASGSCANMHHLSVENFEQFSQAGAQARQRHSTASFAAAPAQLLASGSDSAEWARAEQAARRSSRPAHIHPSTLARQSMRYRAGPQRVSVFLEPGLGAGRRKLSQSLVRRASEWSRMSGTVNVDLRRLLKLWAHTNPYQGRASLGSASSHYSGGGGGAGRPPAPPDQWSPVRAPDEPGEWSQNSRRPSSLGSTRQAYELISAFSRRHDLYLSDAAYSVPLDDSAMAERVSIGLRDRCLAYCLSCLDLLCIWECCELWLRLQHWISVLVFDPFMELFIILCILINTLFMALDSNEVDGDMRAIFERGNYFFTATFAVEASMKIMALSPKFYFREGWNVFDSIIVALSLLELSLEGVYGLSVLRTFRLLRVFKLAKSWPTLNLLISIMGKTVGDLGNLTFVLAIIVFIFAVMGMQLFGNKYVAQSFPDGQLPRWNFTDFMHSFMIVFRILCAEWVEPMWDCLLVGGWPCIPFFLIAVTVGNLVVLSLFLALLLASFGASNLSSPQVENVDTKKLREAIERFRRLGAWLNGLCRASCRWTARALRGLLLGRGGARRAAAPGSERRSGADRKSHIAALSNKERQRNIERRTEELKSRIRRSPQQAAGAGHQHLSELALQMQSRECNYSYLADCKLYNYASKRYLNGTLSGQSSPVPAIPIIVDEVSEVSGDEPASTRHSAPLAEEHQSTGAGSAPASLSSSTSRVFSAPVRGMEPIREDSDRRDSGSCAGTPTSAAKRWKSVQSAVLRGAGQQSADGARPQQVQLVQQPEERSKSSLYLKPPAQENMEEEDERALENIDTYLEECVCLGVICLRWFLFRQSVRKLVQHRYFDRCILALIVISSGTLALEDKHLNERPNLKRCLDVLDTVFTIIFSLEMILKWLAFGLKKYFGNIWSWLDFVIVLVSLINLMASIFGSGKIQALKTMRTLRAMRGLRPLRALQRFQGMRVVVNALIQAIPSIFNVLLVCLIFWLIFSIMGVQMFGGKFWRCLEPATERVLGYEEAANKLECLERNYTWANPQINFDNVLNAYLALFEVATFQGWIDIMNSASDCRGYDEQPIREINIYTYFYFVFFVIVGSFFTLNLFIGVIIDNFNEQKKKTGGSLEIFMTDDQKKYYHAMKKMKSKRPVKAMTRPKFKLQAYVFDITTSKRFDMAIMMTIGLNMFVMALEHHGQSADYTAVLESLNLMFIAVFTLECLSKIFAMRHFYFREPWNIFDFIVVDLSILGVVMKEYVAKYFVSPTLLRVVRVVKIGRVLRLVKGAKGIRTLLFALAMSLPALFNICLLLFLVMFIYAIFGMSFFMNVRPRKGIDETFNFGTFSSSIIVLFELSTSAGWDQVLDPLMDEEMDCQKPDSALGIEGTCGNRSIAIFYLVTYVIITYLIIINMYIAVILENYSQATEDVQEGLTDDDYEMYYEIWQKFDPKGSQYLPYNELSDFLDSLEDPLRIPKPNELAIVVMDINIYKGHLCYCVDILDALTKYFFTRKGLVIQVNDELLKVQSTLHETPFERLTTTYLMKRENYCAWVIQKCWRKWKQKSQASAANKRLLETL